MRNSNESEDNRTDLSSDSLLFLVSDFEYHTAHKFLQMNRIVDRYHFQMSSSSSYGSPRKTRWLIFFEPKMDFRAQKR